MAKGRAIWDGSLTFGLVNIGVGLQSMEKSQEISFSMLDKRDHSPIGYMRINKTTGKEVDWDQIIKGYEYEKDHYVILSKTELEKANVRATQTIDILGFVDADSIPPVYFEKPYYLMPQKKSLKSYNLLREVLVDTKKVGIAKVVIRMREHLAAVMPYQKGLILELLRFAHELKKESELADAPDVKTSPVTKKEKEMAKKLIEEMTEKFDPKQYQDEYYNDLMKLIDKKIDAGEGKTVQLDDDDVDNYQPSKSNDIMDLLRKSLSRTEKSSKSKTAKTDSSKGHKDNVRHIHRHKKAA